MLCSYPALSSTKALSRKVPADLKGVVWGEMKRQIIYPEDLVDEDLCKRHVLFVASKVLHNLRSDLNRNYVHQVLTFLKSLPGFYVPGNGLRNACWLSLV